MNLNGKSQIDQARIEWGIRLRFSPMPRLSMDWIVTQLNSFRIGALWECARTWEIMQERDLELAGSMNKRFEDIGSLDWEILTDDDDGAAHKEALEYFYKNLIVTAALEQDSIGDVTKLFYNIAKAHANYYAVHEIMLRVDDAAKKQITAELRETPIWFFEARRGYLGYLEHLFDVYGQPLKQGEWLPAVGHGYMRGASVVFAIKHFALRDRLLFSQRMGIPWVHGKTDAAIGSTEWNEALKVLDTLSNDGAVLTNKQVEIALLEAASKGQTPMDNLVDYCNRSYDRVFRGSDLASGSRTNEGGGDVVGASVQGGEKDILLQRDAKWITSVLNARLDRPIIKYLFNEEPKARIKVLGPSDEDTQMDLQVAQFCQSARIPYSISTFRQKFGVPEPKPGEALITDGAPPSGATPAAEPGEPQKTGELAGAEGGDKPPADEAIAGGANLNRNPQTIDPGMPGGNKPLRKYNYTGGQERVGATVLPNANGSAQAAGPASQFEGNSEDELLRSILEDHRPLLDQLNDISKIKDPTLFAKRLGAWWDRAQKFIAQLEHDSATQHTVTKILAAGFANGLAAKQPQS